MYAVALAANQFLFYINDAGIVAAVVQWRGKLEDMVVTATTVVITLSVAIYALFWVAAPYFTGLAGNVSATPVVRLLTVIIVIDGFVNVRSAVMLRGFQQDKIAKANMAGIAVQVPVAITLAAHGRGRLQLRHRRGGQLPGERHPGVLLGQDAAAAGLRAGHRAQAAAVSACPWRSAWPSRRWCSTPTRSSSAGCLGAATLGFYMIALNVSSWVPGLVGEALRHVTLPGFSRVAEERPEAFSARVQQIVPMLITLVLPVAVLFGVLAPLVVPFLYGERWLPAAQALSFLMALMVVRMLTALAFDILTSLGATRLVVWMNLELGRGAAARALRGRAAGRHPGRGDRARGRRAADRPARDGAATAPLGGRARAGPARDTPAAPRRPAGRPRRLAGGQGWTEGAIDFVRLCAAGGAGLIVYVVTGLSRDRIRKIREVVTS